MARAGPIVIGYDGTSASRRAIDEAAALFARQKALVVVVWEAGRAFELLESPDIAALPPTTTEVRTAFELDQAMYRSAEQLALEGAALAVKQDMDAEGLAVADEITVPATLVRVAVDVDAPAIVVGAHNKGVLSELLLGSTSREVVRRAPCPVVIVRERSEG